MAEAKTDDERVPTPRVVLKRERVLVLPDALTGEAFEKTKADIAKAVGVRAGALNPVEAWVVVAEVEAATKREAIEAHAGKPGTSTAKAGSFRAPSLRAWKDGITYRRPPEPLIEMEAME
jgi:hypothetical protein